MTVTATILALCWAVFVVFWGVTALNVKRTIERRGGLLRIAVGAVVVLGVALLQTRYAIFVDRPVLPRTLPVGMVADALAIAGAAVLLWARTILGRNWSAAVTLKENHELIQRGPYAYVRHPIYSGMLLLGLATAIYYGTVGGFVLLALCCIGFAFKVRQEEQLMTEHFPDRYAAYKTQVKAIVPFVL
jgi:protein-S-isoprenylcysteine O-methyltransferase Ste14